MENRFSDKASTWRNPIKKPTSAAHRAKLRALVRAYVDRNPWYNSYSSARQRCTNPKNPGYARYGGAGIRFMLTMEEVRSLWLRDGAMSMKRPTLDRIMSGGHYELSNCRFLELRDNSSKRYNPDSEALRLKRRAERLQRKIDIIAAHRAAVSPTFPAPL
jgi:hypothetical protein